MTDTAAALPAALSAETPAPASCLNCAQPLTPPGARFCPHCGQEAHVRPPTLGEFGQQFAGAYISTEGALWRSLRLLLTRPGQLTLEYWRGRRKHYVLPLRLYLTISVLALVLMKLTGSTTVDPKVEARITQSFIKGDHFNIVGMGPLGQVTIEKGQFSCNLPQWICEPIHKRMQGDPAVAMHWLLGVLDRASDHFGQAMFILLPMFAVLTKLLYWRRGRYYTEHLVLALNIHAFSFLMLALGQVPWGPMKVVAFAGTFVYPLIALHKVFGGPVWKNLLRGLTISLLHGVMVLAVLWALLIWALIS